jgi:phage baseplate assembly protein W
VVHHVPAGAGPAREGAEVMALLGKGMAFPPRMVEGRFAWSSDATAVAEAIRLILATEPTERVRLPAFGAGLGRLLFEPNTAATHQLIRGAIERALAAWEPRIRLEEISVEPDRADPEAAIATIAYRLIATGAAERTAIVLTLGRA